MMNEVDIPMLQKCHKNQLLVCHRVKGSFTASKIIVTFYSTGIDAPLCSFM